MRDRLQSIVVFIFINLLALAIDKAITDHFMKEYDR